ncbi:Gamma-tubulin complex component 2 [Branchiostoma belcheri]|nr:Gamma-tubulin complex component 2 [Branchiostoma belcheri]
MAITKESGQVLSGFYPDITPWKSQDLVLSALDSSFPVSLMTLRFWILYYPCAEDVIWQYETDGHGGQALWVKGEPSSRRFSRGLEQAGSPIWRPLTEKIVGFSATMSEFRVHHRVSELQNLLKVRSGEGAEVYADLLLKNMTPAKRKIASFTKTPDDFQRKYDEVKSKNVRELDPLVFLISKLTEDSKTQKFLEQNAHERAAEAGGTLTATGSLVSMATASGGKMSQEEVSELRNKLLSATSGSSILSPESLRRQRDKAKKTVSSVLASPIEHRSPLRTRNSHAFKFQTQFHTLAVPAWVHERPFLTGDFVRQAQPTAEHPVALGTLPMSLQEQAVVEDLLFAMMGVDGKYIQARAVNDKHGHRSFNVDPSLDVSMKELVNRVLPVCSHYSTVCRFMEEKSMPDYGQVNHALCAAMRNLAKEYLILVAQLEHQSRQGQLSLQKFWFYVQPCKRTLEILATIAETVNKVTEHWSCDFGTGLKVSCILATIAETVNKVRVKGQLRCDFMKESKVSRVRTDPGYHDFALDYSPTKGDCRGGAVLSLLHERTASLVGDSKAQDLCLYLTQASCVPYFEILERWIYKGIIVDPYAEFIVEEHESVIKEKIEKDYNDAYWEQRYTICRERIPVFLEKVADKILSTGKYLNVIRQCGRDVKCPAAEEIVYTLKERQYVEQIEKAYNYASRSQVQGAGVLVLGSSLKYKGRVLVPGTGGRGSSPRLRSIKHYFLLDQGDLVSLLELALRTSVANADPYKDDLKVELLNYDLITQLFRILSIETKQEKALQAIDPTEIHISGSCTLQAIDPTEIHISGLEAFAFDYEVKWPLSLIINRKALTRYQMLFRHLFYAKHVERQLCNMWLNSKTAKQYGMWLNSKTAKQYDLQSPRWYAAAFALRHRMLHFVQNYGYYMMFEVLEPNWHMLEHNLKSVSNVDDVLHHHMDFLDKCLKDCMLTNTELLKIVSKLMVVCITFCNCIQRLTRTFLADEELQLTAPAGKGKVTEADVRKTRTKVVSEHVDELVSSDSFEDTITNFDRNFSSLLLSLLDRLSHFSSSDCEHNMMNIIYRIDFNGHYTEQLEQFSAERSMMEQAPDWQPADSDTVFGKFSGGGKMPAKDPKTAAGGE